MSAEDELDEPDLDGAMSRGLFALVDLRQMCDVAVVYGSGLLREVTKEHSEEWVGHWKKFAGLCRDMAKLADDIAGISGEQATKGEQGED